ncbi:MAG TPA: ABC transporter permease, partial [Burkholderiaceae bacterium]|nr:ABC transporter permease [Burkholderiaceae bacterium]
MLIFMLKRISYAVGLLLAVIVLNFLLIHISPGDPVETIAGSMGGITEELKEELRQQFGLDKPFIVQLGVYLGKILQGDFGFSYFFNAPVSELIIERLPATLLLVVTAVLGAFLVGTFMGTLAARKPNGLLSQIVTTLSIVGYSAPVFWTGIVFIILFASVLPIFPVSDMRSSGSDATGLAGVLDVLHHLVLPAFTLAFVYIAQYSRLARASMME